MANIAHTATSLLGVRARLADVPSSWSEDQMRALVARRSPPLVVSRVPAFNCEVTSGQALPPAQTSKGATAPTACGLTRTAMDGERLGRLAWIPGAE
jgi:hypothetical protein